MLHRSKPATGTQKRPDGHRHGGHRPEAASGKKSGLLLFVLLIAQLKHAAGEHNLKAEEARQKGRIMQRILVNDAEIRSLAEPWLDELDGMLGGKARTLH